MVTPRCVPTESMIEFNLPKPGGRLHVRAWADDGKHVKQVSLFFSGSAWNSIHFVSTDFRIRDVESQRTAAAASVTAYRSNDIAKLTTEPYLAAPERRGLSRFQVQVRMDAPLPDDFELLSPAVVIDGEEIVFPPIRFEKKTWLGISPLNC